MGSRENKSTLPPLIDFGDDAETATPSSACTNPFDHTFLSPLQDVVSALEPPHGSAPGNFATQIHTQQWDTPRPTTESSWFDQWDWTSQSSNKSNVLKRKDGDLFASNEIYSGTKSDSHVRSFGYKDFLSDNSSGSVSYPQMDLLSSPEVTSSRRILDSVTSPCVSSQSNHSPLPARTSLDALHSMPSHSTLLDEEIFLDNSHLPDDFQGSCYTDSQKFSPPSISNLSQDSSPCTSGTITNDFRSFNSGEFEKNFASVLTTSDKWEQSQTTCDSRNEGVSENSCASEGFTSVPLCEDNGFNEFQSSQNNQCAGQDSKNLQQNTVWSHGTHTYAPGKGGLKEFRAADSLRVCYKGSERDEDRLVAFELRPQPFKQSSLQRSGALACTERCLWLACDQHLIMWDIPDSFHSGCDGKGNICGDEDAAGYHKVSHGFSTTCLFADTGNGIMWSGHKDGKVRAWPISLEQDKSMPILTWQAHQTPIFAIVISSYGELWTGSDSGSLRVWPREALSHAFASSKVSELDAASNLAISYIDLKSQGWASGISSLLTIDIRFLIAEHSQCRVWSGGSYLLAVWDARTKEVLKVFGSNAEAEFISPKVSPVRESGRIEEVKVIANRSVKREKNQGPLSFFQRSRNAVFGAADAVLRVAVGQSIDDSKKMEAVVSALDGSVWIGYADGHLGQWDSSISWLADHRYSSSAIRCIYAFGSRIFVGYADGVVHILDVTTGKFLGRWRAHKSSIAKLGVCHNHLFTLADNGCLRGWLITSPSVLDKSLRCRLTAKEGTYLRQENIKLLACTWNVSQEKASLKSLDSWLGKGSMEASIVVIGLQEVEMGAGALAMAAARETVGLAGSDIGQWWLVNIEEVLLKKKSFSRVGSRQLAGLLIGVWVTEEIFPYIGNVEVSAVACGFGRAFGNKGAVAVKMLLFRRTICIINCHFAAHMDGVAKRNADFDHIYHRMSFRRPSGLSVAATSMAAVQIIRGNSMRSESSSSEQFDNLLDKDIDSGEPAGDTSELSEAELLIWVGDFNYRLADVSYTEAVDLVRLENWEELLKKDQLRLEMKAGRVFQGMREAYIMFQPTYKFDKGSKFGYDSSDKKRIPAWCDRVLYRDSFESKDVVQKVGCSHPIAVSASRYDSCLGAIESDHKPVSCLLDVQIAVVNEAARRWEYGRFLRTNEEALAEQKQINSIPNIVIHTNDLVLVNKARSILKITNESTKEIGFFSIHSEGEHFGSFPNNQAIKQKELASSALPLWLQVLPSSGIIHPTQTIEVAVQYASSENDLGPELALNSGSCKTAVLLVNVKGCMSSLSNQYRVTIHHTS
ncbi:hypothetical protein KP509_16G012900 [Ceratopteris richardii]|uniref:Inositol polyphosphate-related phosphatase domain-containing protein n=1 Tax=Ceratopteris richardii TaxID=49495 RepID=A0A8T2SYA2_CERRI|nr:hypothetical protein KP509_16G012900 [Ceratopteris richardii]